MTKRTPPEIQQKIIADNKLGRYTHLQIGQKYGISRQCVWAVVNRYKKNQHLPAPSKSDMIKILNKVNFGEAELRYLGGNTSMSKKKICRNPGKRTGVSSLKTLKLTCAFCEVQLKPLEMGICRSCKEKNRHLRSWYKCYICGSWITPVPVPTFELHGVRQNQGRPAEEAVGLS